MEWLDVVTRDPVPWLLDPANPSARFLTLRDIFRRPPGALTQDREALLTWSPIQELLEEADPVSFWGRTTNPYFGGPLGNFGTLYALTQIGAPPIALLKEAGENLLEYGRLRDGRFGPQSLTEETWLCYTGMALQVLRDLEMQEDPRFGSAARALTQVILHQPERLYCDLAGEICPWGMVKALEGLLRLPKAQQDGDVGDACKALVDRLLNYPFDFDKRNADWLEPTYPHYYASDLIDLCHALARAGAIQRVSYRQLEARLREMQTPNGRWVKIRPSPGRLDIEPRRRPSRWLTWKAVHTFAIAYGNETYAT